MRLKTFPGGSHPPDQKHFSSSEPITELPLAEKVVIHLSQHIGAPSTPFVKVGDEVKKGDLIAGAAGFVSLNQHASISGKSWASRFLSSCKTIRRAERVPSAGNLATALINFSISFPATDYVLKTEVLNRRD